MNVCPECNQPAAPAGATGNGAQIMRCPAGHIFKIEPPPPKKTRAAPKRPKPSPAQRPKQSRARPPKPKPKTAPGQAASAEPARFANLPRQRQAEIRVLLRRLRLLLSEARQ